jgi:3-hydroxyacyl-CoA dehydrogenase
MSASYRVDGNIAVITFNNPPVNGLGKDLRAGIMDGLHKAQADVNVKAIVLVGGGKNFSGGADIKEFGKPEAMASPTLHEVIAAIEASPKLVIAAMHGPTMGGGCEVALGCHYRIAAPDTLVALPEVKLGILPGAGGTQRMPRLIGVEAALRLITTGDPVKADKLVPMGFADEMASGEIATAGIAFAKKLVAENSPLRKVRDMTAKLPEGIPAAAFFAAAREQVKKASRGFPAPLKCLDCVEAAATKPFDEGIKVERELFMQLVASSESASLRHAFFAERMASKIPDVPEDTPTREIKSAAIIGAGTMGGGIAMNFVNVGIPVKILEMKQEALDKGMATIKKNYANTVAKGKLKQEDMDKRMSLLTGTLNYDDLKNADIVIEAVFEDMAVKETVFKTLDKVMKPGAILASNTSTLDVDKIANFTSRPQDVIGTHFFSPANVMRLLEVVRGAKTGKDVLATTMKLGKAIKKVSVVSGVCDGFIGNRMIEEYSRQAGFLLEEGALPQQVDKAMNDFGMAMGPFQMGDLAGNDVGWYIRKRRVAERPGEQHYSKIADKICELGRFGQKTGAGWYKYEAGNRAPIPDQIVEDIIVNHRKELDITPRTISDAEIIERLVYALTNTGAKILEEGIALRASDIDLIYLTGYGFPAYRGGPMFYAQTVGLKKVYDRINEFEQKHGKYWKPAPLLKQLAEQGKSGWK